jgi:hypothetical protein
VISSAFGRMRRAASALAHWESPLFMMSLFIATLAFEGTTLVDSAKSVF